jgi:hypothetical protein
MPYCLGATLDEVSTDGSGSSPGYRQPHRVAVYMVVVFILFYALVIGFFVVVYSILRRGPARRYAELFDTGEIVEEVDDGAEMEDPAARTARPLRSSFLRVQHEALRTGAGWMSKPIAEVYRDSGLDAALYLTHVKQMAIYCTVHFCTMGLGLVSVYVLAGDVEGDEQSLSMFAWSYANLGPNNGLRFITVAASYWCIVTTMYFCRLKRSTFREYNQKSEDEAGARGATSRFTAWISGVDTKATKQQLDRYFAKHYSGEVEAPRPSVARPMSHRPPYTNTLQWVAPVQMRWSPPS